MVERYLSEDCFGRSGSFKCSYRVSKHTSVHTVSHHRSDLAETSTITHENHINLRRFFFALCVEQTASKQTNEREQKKLRIIIEHLDGMPTEKAIA